MEQTTRDILEKVADTTLGSPLKLVVDVHTKNKLHGWLQKRKIAATKKVLTIQPIVLGNLVRISTLLLSIDPGSLSEKDLQESSYKLMKEHGETIARVIAIACHNKREDPPQSLVDFILWHFSPIESRKVLAIVIKQMEVQNFMTTIISARGLNVLDSEPKKNGKSEMSPLTQGRKIAPGTSLED